MTHAVLPLLDALSARGKAPFVVQESGSVTAASFLGRVRAAATLLQRASPSLEACGVVGLRSRYAPAQIVAACAAWDLGISTAFLSPREPTSRVPVLLREAGCRLLLDGDEVCEVRATDPSTPRIQCAETSTLVWTSGSGGAPKVAVHDLPAHLESARAAASYFDLGLEDTWLLSLPVHHVGGLSIVLRTVLSGARLAVPEVDTPLAVALERLAPTHVSLVPTQLRRLLASAEATARLRACRAVLVGGGPVPSDLRVGALDRGVPLVVSYGMTETSAFVAAAAEPELARRRDCVGRPLPGRPVRIAGSGEIHVGGPTLFTGYLEDHRIRRARDAEGFFATGDCGRLDEDGVLYVEGRRDRLFISGGENVQPEEIESALEALDGIDAAVVVDVADEEYGRRPVAFVRGREDVLDAPQLAADLRSELAGFKVPDAFYRLPAEAPGSLKPSPARLALLLQAEADLERL